ncbi:MAG: glycosyltransferase family 4 protein [Gemmatimonadota bacterium]|nr:glycosyltransferase family 4 protein [Gemmatimonadota bacterium]
MTAARRVLTIGHSYCVRRNRELAEAMNTGGGGAWSITVAAPERFPGDLGPIETRREESEGAELRTLPVHGARRIHVMRYGRGLQALLDEPWDLVHCWEEPYVLAGAQVARAHRPGTALVYASFQNIAKRYPPPFGAFERYSLRQAAGWIAFGRTVEATLQTRPAYAARPHAVIPFGVDVTRFAPDRAAGMALRARLGWKPDGPPVIGYLGRFVEAKGLGVLLEALHALRARGGDWRALFVGGGPWDARLRAFAERHGDRVRIRTGVPHDDVPDHLRAMDMLCVPSQTTPNWREQFGRMIVEAFACGVPVVGSDSGEIPGVIGDAGLVVGERDVPTWTRTLADLLEDPARRGALGARGRARAETTFAWPVVGRQHLAFFDRILNR